MGSARITNNPGPAPGDNRRVETSKYNEIWITASNNGEGFPVGVEGQDINTLTDELGELIQRASSDTDVAVYRDTEGRVTVVAEASGPWAVRA